MAPVDPTILLSTIAGLLDGNGGLKNERVLRQFLTLMKLAEKLVNKSIYLQILRQTKAKETLHAFSSSNGHQILLKWLSDFTRKQQQRFALDTLHILGDLPLNFATIAQAELNELQFNLNELTSAQSGFDKDIRESARHFYDIWLTKGLAPTRQPSTNDPLPPHDRPMATTATLTPVSSTPAATTENNSPVHRKATALKASLDLDQADGVNASTSSYRTPQRTNSVEMNESATTTTAGTLHRQSSDESNSQQGKRKFSLSQYKEHKRLKSNEIQQTLADTDMRVDQQMPNIKPSPSSIADDEVPNITDLPSVVSPRSEEISKDPIIKSNLSEPGVKKVKKKKVIWADEKNQSLVHTSFFEVDDSEVSDMHVFARQCATNMSIAQLEKVMERDLRKRRGPQDSNESDEKQHSTPLPRLIKILLPEAIQPPPIISQERLVQEEREKTVLQALFIRSFLPDTPGEPDGELPTTSTEPKLIPLQDDTSATVSNKVTSSATVPTAPIATPVSNSPTPAPTPTPAIFSFASASPEVAQILAQAKGNASTATANHLSTFTTTTANTSAAPTATLANANLPAPPNFLSAFLNGTRTATTNEAPTIPPPPPPPLNSSANLLAALPMTFNLPLPPPAPFPLALIANVLSLGIPPPPPPTATNPSLFQPPPAAFPSMPNLSTPLGSSGPPPASANTGNHSKPPSVRFISATGQQPRPNLSDNNHPMSSSRENSRDHQHFRRGPPHHNRRDYYPNRNNNNNNNNTNNNNSNHNNNSNNNNNNNRNIFS